MANAQATIPTIEDFEAEARSPRGWVNSFITQVKASPNTPLQSPYNKKSTPVMLKQAASTAGISIQTLERDGKLWVLYKNTEPVAQQTKQSDGEAAATPRTTMPKPSV